jgi:hypothetical protein
MIRRDMALQKRANAQRLVDCCVDIAACNGVSDPENVKLIGGTSYRKG